MAVSAASAAVCGDQDISVEFYSPRTAHVLKTPVGATFHKPFETRVAKTWDGTVTVKSGAVLDISKSKFSCSNLVRNPGGRIVRGLGFMLIVE